VSSTAAQAAPRSLTALVVGIVRSTRPRQWSKNGLVMVALFFTVNYWWDTDDLSGMAVLIGRSLLALAIFCIVTGANYLINDVFDIDSDRAHPRKRLRPIAAGVVPVPIALATGVILAAAGLGLSFLLGFRFAMAIVAYLALTQSYTLALKKMVILDVMAVAAGFVIRAAAGSLAIDGVLLGPQGAAVPLAASISPWLYICTALGALFIALAKRRAEIAEAGVRSASQRTILAEYSVAYLDLLIAIVAPSALVAYSLYTFGGNLAQGANVPDNNSMMVTIPFVAYGIFRYLYLVYQKGRGESPEEILIADPPMLATVVLWLLAAAGVLLFNR
jgi:4-hydroxybenzoate polyprenyltransferase